VAIYQITAVHFASIWEPRELVGAIISTRKGGEIEPCYEIGKDDWKLGWMGAWDVTILNSPRNPPFKEGFRLHVWGVKLKLLFR